MNAPAAAPVVAAAWCLRFLSGAVRGRTIALKVGANTVGSERQCEVMLPAGDVLPQHLVFTVGALAVTVQRVGDAAARLNGEEMTSSRRSVVAGDVVSVGQLDFQLDRVYPAPDRDDRMLDDADGAPEASATVAAAPAAPARRTAHWVGGGAVLLALVGLIGVDSWNGANARRIASQGIDLVAVEKALAGFTEVEAVAASGGGVTLRGYVESRARRVALQEAVGPFGVRVVISVLSAEEIVEQARRFVTDPGVSVAYAGRGLLVVSGTSEDEGVRRQVRRLTEDLHPAVLVSDNVQYGTRGGDRGAQSQAQWAAWQAMLPSRIVGISEDSQGLRHIQLANGSRYYEGAMLSTGAELKRIGADGLVIGTAPPRPAP